MVEEIEKTLDDDFTDGGESAGKGVGAQEDGSADDFFGERLADAATVIFDEVALVMLELGIGDQEFYVASEAGVDAVDDFASVQFLLQDLLAAAEIGAKIGIGAQSDGTLAAHDGEDVFEMEACGGDRGGGGGETRHQCGSFRKLRRSISLTSGSPGATWSSLPCCIH